jgi:hypothetical protein
MPRKTATDVGLEQPLMSGSLSPSGVPLYEDQATRDEQYGAAEAESRPFFAVEQYEEGYAVTFDLLPAGAQLTEAARTEVRDLVTARVEALVADPDDPTAEVGHTVSDSLGNVSFLHNESTARELAADISEVVLDEANWEPATKPGGGANPGNRRND